MEQKKYCTYIRVSTRKQGSSGLGLEAQRNVCANYIASQKGLFDREFREVESGTKRDRKVLLAAIDYCKENNCVLVFANLSRLARDIEFTFKVINTGIEVYFCDMPQINTLILGVMAAVAQYERERTSKRTIDALAENKKKGIINGAGNPNYHISEESKRNAIQKRKQTVNESVIESADFATFCRILRKNFRELDIPSDGEKFFLKWPIGVKIGVDSNKASNIILDMKEAHACNKELFANINFDAENINAIIRSRIQSTFKTIKKYHELNNQYHENK